MNLREEKIWDYTSIINEFTLCQTVCKQLKENQNKITLIKIS